MSDIVLDVMREITLVDAMGHRVPNTYILVSYLLCT